LARLAPRRPGIQEAFSMKTVQAAGALALAVVLAACSSSREPLVTVIDDGCLTGPAISSS
jgi:hypothetical protein